MKGGRGGKGSEGRGRQAKTVNRLIYKIIQYEI